MWTYKQSNGALFDPGHTRIGTGYAGAGVGRNNSALQDRHDIGPLPQGMYQIGPPQDLQGGPHGHYVLPLTPDKSNVMYGRAGFLIHGDNLTHTASEGCIIVSRPIREMVNASGDRTLGVIA